MRFTHEFRTFTGDTVIIFIEVPLNECRMHRKIEKDIKEHGAPWGKKDFSYALSEEERKAVRERFLSDDLFSENVLSLG